MFCSCCFRKLDNVMKAYFVKYWKGRLIMTIMLTLLLLT